MTAHNDSYSDVGDDEFEEHSDSGDGEFSPTDGYFNNRTHPQEVFVQSPTTSTHAKRVEAGDAEPSTSSPRPDHPQQRQHEDEDLYEHRRSTPTSPTRSLPDEATPLLYDAPPPAYSGPQPLINPPLPPEELRSAESPLATTPLLAPAEPESMGRPENQDVERNYYIKPPPGRIHRVCRVMCHMILVFVAVIILLFIVMDTFVRSGRSEVVRLLPLT